MKLLRCNIVNYGCLHDYSYEFAEGINLINRPNGWGKSTFVSFLCAMLYGLDSTNKRSIHDNERKHYQPWQGGAFGGSLEFESAGRQYRVERFFGRREKEDTFILYDLKTMLPSRAYSCRLGFELFGIDKAGFLKSSCIPQGKPALEYNDTLAAKLTGLTQSSDDISQYEQAIAAIDKALRFYVKTGKRGEISLLRQEADFTAQQLQEALETGCEIKKLISDLKVLEKQKDQIHNQLACIQHQIDLSSRLEVQSHYNLLNHQLEQKELELEHMEDFFHDLLPEESDIQFYLQTCSHLTQTMLQIQQEKPDDLQISEYTFLKNFFNDCQATDSDETCSEKTGNAASKEVFTFSQKKLLINSVNYKTEAALLFSSEEEDFLFETPAFQGHLPDLETIHLAKNLYLQYQDLLSSKKNEDNAMITLSEQLDSAKISLKEEYRLISDCRQQIELLQQSNFFTEPPPDQEDYGKENEMAPAGQSVICSLFLSSLLLAVITLLTGYFISPFIGFIIGLTGMFFIVYRIVQLRKDSKNVSDSCHGAHIHGLQPDSCADTDLQRQSIQLETELQLRMMTCTQLEKQTVQLQKQLDSAQENASVSAAEADACMQKLFDISKQLNLPVNEHSLLTDEYLTHLARLTSHLENHERILKRQHEQSKKQLAFYRQLEQTYEDYIQRFQNLKKLDKTASDLKKSVTEYLRPYFSVSDTEPPSSLEAKLHNLRTQLVSYKKALSDRKLASNNLDRFLQEHADFQMENQGQSQNTVQVQQLKSLKDLQCEESSLREQYTDYIRQISFCQSQIRQKQDIADKYHSLEDKSDHLEQQIASYQERYRILSLTRQYLTRARQDFSDNYLRSIEKNFNHYAKFFEKELLLDVNMDSNFHVLISDRNILRETGWYSQGIRDLIELCSRLAIIEDLFQDEPPFLILDDPFVNMDDSSMEHLSHIMRKLADKWQILYFTCHSSRNI